MPSPPSSSTTTAAAADDIPENTTTTTAATTNNDPTPPPPPPTVRKFPAPCWTQDETLALIHAYQDKWYSLRRRNLRTADWESVADEVNRRCPDQCPPKTSAQCRHKMEKLRKRYRAEKQRISSLPFVPNNRFFPSSSWVFFDLMDSMEVGPGSGPQPKDKESLNLGQSNPTNKEEKKGKDDLGKYFDEILMSMGKNTNTSAVNNTSTNNNPMKFKVKNQNERYFNDDDDEDHHHDTSKYCYDGNGNASGNGNGGFDYVYGGVGKSMRGLGGGFGNNKRKFGGGGGGERYVEESSSSKRGGMRRERERGRDAVVEEMAASIKMLGEGLIRMETVKMEMMQEIERKRMEMEMKRNEMMLQSQHAIVNAFLQGFKKHKKSATMQLE